MAKSLAPPRACEGLLELLQKPLITATVTCSRLVYLYFSITVTCISAVCMFQYYSGLGLSEEEKQQRMKSCRHRSRFAPPPSTPEHYWDVDFPSTQESKKRGAHLKLAVTLSSKIISLQAVIILLII